MAGENPETFLASFGWNTSFQNSFDEDRAPNDIPGRIISQGKGHYHVQVGPQTVVEAAVTSQLRNSTKSILDFPGVGDWVVLSHLQSSQKATIQRVLTRRNILQRKRGGASQEPQLLVSNVDHVFIVTSLNEDFDLQRLGRYLAIGKDSGAEIVFVLSKTDLCSTADEYVKQLQDFFGSVTIHKISNRTPATVQPLVKYFPPGKTTVLLGSSGVGKSTLTNYLLGLDQQKTQGLSGETRGRHTTTSRNLLVTQWGGLVIDTPGMQEVSTVEPITTTQKTFPDIEELMLQCKFTNCRHGNDPGCAISKGIKNGSLDPHRWQEYLKTQDFR